MFEPFEVSVNNTYETKTGTHIEFLIDGNLEPFVEILHLIAEKCNTVTEFGTGSFSSSVIFMTTPGFTGKHFITYDFRKLAVPEQVTALSQILHVNYTSRQGNTLKIEIEPTDLLFIDTQHTYTQLINELRLHSPKVRKYIACHDTVLYRHIGEGINEDLDYHICPHLATKGLGDAINDFLDEDEKINKKPTWKIIYDSSIQTGLTILERKNLNV